ncbi:hypothetical protein C8J57DRAFT_320757 [Mycena rebaudengoi]|nr:hypothetical protein C8J57DRAFT_320757 [Mycena rebaudengoi]
MFFAVISRILTFFTTRARTRKLFNCVLSERQKKNREEPPGKLPKKTKERRSISIGRQLQVEFRLGIIRAHRVV